MASLTNSPFMHSSPSALSTRTKNSLTPFSNFPFLKFKSPFHPSQTLTLHPNHKSLISPPPRSTAVAALSFKSLKSRLKNGETLYGIFLLTFSPTIAEISGLAGYDFAVVDMEHGHGGISDSLHCLHALAAANTAAILRLPESSAAWAKKALDLGPQGIMFPMIDGPKSARKAVSYCRYPPAGVRGSAHPIIRGSDYGIDEGYLTNYEEELLIMCQVESEEAVDKIGEISAVDGMDCIQMGPLDLSGDMGYLWDPGHKKVKEMLHKAEKAVLKGGEAYLSGFATPQDGPEKLRQRGYHMVAGATDVGMYRVAAVEDVKKFKKELEEEEEGKGIGKVGDEKKYWSE